MYQDTHQSSIVTVMDFIVIVQPYSVVPPYFIHPPEADGEIFRSFCFGTPFVLQFLYMVLVTLSEIFTP